MTTSATRNVRESMTEGTLFVAFELSEKTWNSIFKFFSLAIRAVLIFQVLHSIGATHNHGVAFG